MSTGYGTAYSIGQGQYRAVASVWATNTSETTVTYTVKVWGQLKNINGWDPSELWFLQNWNGSNYTKRENHYSGNMHCTWSADWQDTNFVSQGGGWTATRTHSKYTIWFASEVKCGNGAYSRAQAGIEIPAKPSYTVSYNANGGSGAPSASTKWYGENLTLSSTKPTRTNYQFLGWSTSSTATSATYSAGGTYTANSGAVLYAVWKDITPPTISQSQSAQSETQINISGTSNVDCKQWAYKVDNGSWVYWTGSARSGSNVINVSKGSHTVQIAGQKKSNDVWGFGTTVTVDTTLPVVSATFSDIATDSFHLSATSTLNCNSWEYSLNNGSSWTVFSTANGKSASTTVTGLRVNTTYNILVRARRTLSSYNNLYSRNASYSVKTQGGIVHVKVNGAWKEAIAYVKINNAWRQAICYTKVGSSWRINT